MADTRKSEGEREIQTLRDKPQRQKKRGASTLFGVLGAIIIVAILVFVGWQFLAGGHNPLSPNSGGKTGSNASATIVGDNDPAVYWSTLKQQVAEGLRLSVSDIQGKVQSASSGGGGTKSGGNVSPPIVDVAGGQHIAGSQWRTIEINAIQKADNALVGTHTLTQQQADQRVQDANGWTQDNLDGYINYAFSSHSRGLSYGDPDAVSLVHSHDTANGHPRQDEEETQAQRPGPDRVKPTLTKEQDHHQQRQREKEEGKVAHDAAQDGIERRTVVEVAGGATFFRTAKGSKDRTRCLIQREKRSNTGIPVATDRDVYQGVRFFKIA